VWVSQLTPKVLCVVGGLRRAGFHFKFFSFAYMSRLAFSLAFLLVGAYIGALASTCTG
jgi:hypothetical protein